MNHYSMYYKVSVLNWLKRKIAPEENIGSVWSNEETVSLFLCSALMALEFAPPAVNESILNICLCVVDRNTDFILVIFLEISLKVMQHLDENLASVTYLSTVWIIVTFGGKKVQIKIYY